METIEDDVENAVVKEEEEEEQVLLMEEEEEQVQLMEEEEAEETPEGTPEETGGDAQATEDEPMSDNNDEVAEEEQKNENDREVESENEKPEYDTASDGNAASDNEVEEVKPASCGLSRSRRKARHRLPVSFVMRYHSKASGTQGCKYPLAVDSGSSPCLKLGESRFPMNCCLNPFGIKVSSDFGLVMPINLLSKPALDRKTSPTHVQRGASLNSRLVTLFRLKALGMAALDIASRVQEEPRAE
eukprot:1181857-Prorocentrum_minimum.AAC.3